MTGEPQTNNPGPGPNQPSALRKCPSSTTRRCQPGTYYDFIARTI
jgi:hypothetical protein